MRPKPQPVIFTSDVDLDISFNDIILSVIPDVMDFVSTIGALFVILTAALAVSTLVKDRVMLLVSLTLSFNISVLMFIMSVDITYDGVVEMIFLVNPKACCCSDIVNKSFVNDSFFICTNFCVGTVELTVVIFELIICVTNFLGGTKLFVEGAPSKSDCTFERVVFIGLSMRF